MSAWARSFRSLMHSPSSPQSFVKGTWWNTEHNKMTSCMVRKLEDVYFPVALRNSHRAVLHRNNIPTSTVSYPPYHPVYFIGTSSIIQCNCIHQRCIMSTPTKCTAVVCPNYSQVNNIYHQKDKSIRHKKIPPSIGHTLSWLVNGPGSNPGISSLTTLWDYLHQTNSSNSRRYLATTSRWIINANFAAHVSKNKLTNKNTRAPGN